MGLIEVRSAELLPGSEAEVIILIEKAAPPVQAEGLATFIGAAKGVYADAEDADRAVRAERDAWEI